MLQVTEALLICMHLVDTTAQAFIVCHGRRCVGARERSLRSRVRSEQHVGRHDCPCARRDQVDAVVNIICSAARTGEIGDGKIFVSPVAGRRWLCDSASRCHMHVLGSDSCASLSPAPFALQTLFVSGQAREEMPGKGWLEAWQIA